MASRTPKINAWCPAYVKFLKTLFFSISCAEKTLQDSTDKIEVFGEEEYAISTRKIISYF